MQRLPLKPQEQGKKRETPKGRQKDGSERQAMKVALEAWGWQASRTQRQSDSADLGVRTEERSLDLTNKSLSDLPENNTQKAGGDRSQISTATGMCGP